MTYPPTHTYTYIYIHGNEIHVCNKLLGLNQGNIFEIILMKTKLFSENVLINQIQSNKNESTDKS